MADAYGLEDRAALVDGIKERQTWSAGWWRARLEQGLVDEERGLELVSWNLRERDYVEEQRAVFLSLLV